ncbi:MAG TPA: hypothetical protein PKD90_07865 [Phnomibacter sp.]|nr:hypothetical protein [Phnomibacter sp.]
MFYAVDNPAYPDEIDIRIIHAQGTHENVKDITTGVYLYLDNLLGELEFVLQIDNLEVLVAPSDAQHLIPVTKLKEYLVWRQKEFIEKYEGVHYHTEQDAYTVLEGKHPDGDKMLAVVNAELMEWDSKASHPWMAVMTVKFDGSRTHGMPDGKCYQRLMTLKIK